MSTPVPEASPVIPAAENNGSLNNVEPGIPAKEKNEPAEEMDISLVDNLFCTPEGSDINLQKSSDDVNGIKIEKENMEVEDNIDKAIAEATSSAVDSIELKQEEDEESSDSDDSTSSYFSDSDSSEMELPTRNLTKEEREKALIAFDEMGGEECDGEQHKEIGEVLRTLHEVTDIKIVKPNIVITPEMTLQEIGAVYAIVENVIVIEAPVVREYRALDHGSLLVWEDRTVLGEVFETFGPITRPLYAVRFNNASEIDREHAVTGAKVFYVSDYDQFVRFVQIDHLKHVKGSDASNRWDEEVDEDELEFSDDEEELKHKRELKLKKKIISRQNPSHSQSYPDEGYNILKRPPYNPPPLSVQPSSLTSLSPTKMVPQKPVQHYDSQRTQIHSTAAAQAQLQIQTTFQAPQPHPDKQLQQTTTSQLSPQIAQITSLADATPEQLISALMQFSDNQMSPPAQISQLPTGPPEYDPYINAYTQQIQQIQQYQQYQEHQFQQRIAYERERGRGRGRGRGWPHGRGGISVAEQYQHYQYQDPSNGNGGYY